MSEPAPLPRHSPAEPEFAAAARLGRAVAVLGQRLAMLLGTQFGAEVKPMFPGEQEFLERMFELWAGGPAPGESTGDGFARVPGPGGHPLDRLAAGLALSPVEVDLILLAGMPEEHEGYGSVLRSLNPRGEARPNVGLAAQLLGGGWQERAELRRLLYGGALVRSGILSLAGESGFFEQDLVLAPGLWPVLGGLDVWPPSLRPLPLSAAAAGLESWLDTLPVRRAMRALASGVPGILLIAAESEEIAGHRAAVLAERAGVRAIGFEIGPGIPAGGERLGRVHALARGAVPIFRVAPAEPGAAETLPDLADFPGIAVVCTRRGRRMPSGELPLLSLMIDPLPAGARRRLWRETLPELAALAPILAARYGVEPAAAARIARDARAMAALDGGTVDLESVAESVRQRSVSALATGVRIVRPAAGWDQLVLPEERKSQLAEALQRLFHQERVLEDWKFLEGRPGARGVRILMSGPPGTGKTLSAEVMARSLGVDLLVADISRIVSKWIGETEKHLAELFDLAEQAQAVLLFDEADALFGRRTEVSDAHDRYANLETAYLLSRLERFEGLAMLSTNLKQNVDPAFLRRIEFVIDFDEPSAAERESLWRCHLPPTAPLSDDVNLKDLAAFYPIVGGLIRNASAAAAFRAAAAGAPVSLHHLIGAIRREYEKSGKAFPGVPAGLSLN